MLKKILPVIVVLSLAFILNCGAKLDSGAISPVSLFNFNSGPSSMIYSVYPDNNSNGISRTPDIRVYFAVDMNPGSFTASSIMVTDENNNIINGTVGYVNRIASFTFIPAGFQLDYSKKYTVTLSTSITDSVGNPLPPNQKFEFTTVDVNTVPAPEFNLMGGSYTGPQSVNVTCDDPLATIHYTTDGSTPSPTNGLIYTGTPIPISANATLRAMAERSGMNDSAVTSAVYTILVFAPAFNLAGGTYNNDIDIDITCATTGAVIHYTTDGSIPTTASPVYGGIPIPIGGEGTSITVRAIAVKPGMANSAITSAIYTISYFQAADPTFNPPAGPFTSPQNVIVDTTSPGAIIRYTTDGSDPTISMTYTDATPPVTIPFNDTMTINAFVVSAAELIPSNVSTVTYIMAPTITSISPNSCDNSIGTVTMTVTGTNFKTGAAVRLTRPGHTDIPATGISLAGNTITCSFDISTASAGQWNVMVNNTDTGSATLANGFRVYALPAGLAGWWPLDGNFLDTMGGNNGSPSGTINFVADRFGNAASAGSCGAMMNKVIAPIVNGIPYGTMPRTMMGWIKADALHAGTDNYLFGYGQIPELFTMYVYKIAPNTGILIFDAGNGNTVQGKTLLHTGQWYHVTVTYDGGTSVSLYVNGVLDISGTISAALNTTDGTDVQFFQYGSFPAWLEGDIDDVRIYNGVLPQTDIQTLAANAGYLVPPQNFDATRGTQSGTVTITWDPVLDATEYDVYRSSLLGGPYTKINSTAITSTTYSDTPVTDETIYYYKATAKNSAIQSDFSDISIGYGGTPPATFTESFPNPPGIYDAWWSNVTAVNTPYVINGTGDHTGMGSYGLYVGPSACSSGCGFNNEMRFTKDFSATPITYFSLSMWFYRQTMNGGEVRVYVNNPDPTDTTGMVPFFNPTQPIGWIQRSLIYMGNPGSITSITIVFYDITNSNGYYADDIVINYK